MRYRKLKTMICAVVIVSAHAAWAQTCSAPKLEFASANAEIAAP